MKIFFCPPMSCMKSPRSPGRSARALLGLQGKRFRLHGRPSKMLWIFISAFWLCGCASLSNPNLETTADASGLEARLQLLIGTPESELPARLRQVLELAGPLELMNAECLPGNSREVEFYWEHRYEVPLAYQRYAPNPGVSFWGFYGFFGIGWSPSDTPAAPPVKPCSLWFTGKDGVITGFRTQGAGCERFAPTLPDVVLSAPPAGDADLMPACPR